MKICSNNGLACRLGAAALMLAGATGLRAEAIIITRPAIAIVAPPRESDNLPRAKGREIEFSTAPQQMPILPQTRQRQQPRSRDEDEEANVHWLLKDPKKLPGVFGKDPLKATPLFAEKNPLLRPWQNSQSDNKDEDAQSTSPITSFDWNERDARDARNSRDARNKEEETRRNSFATKEEKDDERDTRTAFGFRPNKTDERRDGTGASTSYDSFSARPRQEPELSEYFEKRSSLQEFLNPRPASSVKQPGSLEPVATFETPRPVQNVPASAATATRPPLISRAPTDPSQAFKERQARSGNNVFEDPGARYSDQAGAKPLVPRSEPVFQTPLLRQPIQREIPGRKF